MMMTTPPSPTRPIVYARPTHLAQVGFISFLVGPLYATFAGYLGSPPPLMAALACLRVNRALWEADAGDALQVRSEWGGTGSGSHGLVAAAGAASTAAALSAAALSSSSGAGYSFTAGTHIRSGSGRGLGAGGGSFHKRSLSGNVGQLSPGGGRGSQGGSTRVPSSRSSTGRSALASQVVSSPHQPSPTNTTLAGTAV